MGHPLTALERLFERFLERPAARLFHAPLEPLQLQRRAERAMEAGRRTGAGRIFVPDRYRILLHPDDLASFAGYRATLARDLEDGLLAFARHRGYTLPERPRITLDADPRRRPGEVEVEVEVEVHGAIAEPEVPAGFRLLPDEDSPSRRAFEATAVFAVPPAPAAAAQVVVHVPGAEPRRLLVHGPQVRIGRSPDNDVVVADGKVSRHHGRLRVRRDALLYEDLESRNGSFVDGVRVREIALAPGDVIRLGDSALAIEGAEVEAAGPA